MIKTFFLFDEINLYSIKKNKNFSRYSIIYIFKIDLLYFL